MSRIISQDVKCILYKLSFEVSLLCQSDVQLGRYPDKRKQTDRCLETGMEKFTNVLFPVSENIRDTRTFSYTTSQCSTQRISTHGNHACFPLALERSTKPLKQNKQTNVHVRVHGKFQLRP